MNGFGAYSCCFNVENSTEAGDGGAGAAPDAGEEHDGGAASELSPDKTPTNEMPSMPLLSGKSRLRKLSFVSCVHKCTPPDFYSN